MLLDQVLTQRAVEYLVVQLHLLWRQLRVQHVLFLRRQVALDLGLHAPQKERFEDLVQLPHDVFCSVARPARERPLDRLRATGLVVVVRIAEAEPTRQAARTPRRTTPRT